MRAVLLILAGVVLVGAGAAFALHQTANEPPAKPVKRAPAAPAKHEQPTEMSAPTPPVTEAPRPKSDMLVFPDGTALPPLNGVEKPGPVQWPEGRPYSPVVGKHTEPNGLEWYDHADGTMTTTTVTWRKDLNRYDGVTLMATPKKPLPIAADELQREKERMEKEKESGGSSAGAPGR